MNIAFSLSCLFSLLFPFLPTPFSGKLAPLRVKNRMPNKIQTNNLKKKMFSCLLPICDWNPSVGSIAFFPLNCFKNDWPISLLLFSVYLFLLDCFNTDYWPLLIFTGFLLFFSMRIPIKLIFVILCLSISSAQWDCSLWLWNVWTAPER